MRFDRHLTPLTKNSSQTQSNALPVSKKKSPLYDASKLPRTALKRKWRVLVAW